MQKKENEKYKQEIQEFRDIIDEKQKDEEPIDLAQYFKNKDEDERKSAVGPQSKLMQTRMNSQ